MCSRPVALIAVVWATAAAGAQNGAFEVASVKPLTEVQRGVLLRSGARYYEPMTFLRSVIEFAYNLSPVRIVGGPDWIHSDLWGIDARASAPASADEMRAMVRRLLADRFALVAHVETRDQPLYEMRLSRRDGRLGPNAKPAEACEPVGARSPEAIRAAGAKVCGPSAQLVGPGFARVAFQGVPMSTLAAHLERPLGRVVRDHTGVDVPLDLTECHRPYPHHLRLQNLGQPGRRRPGLDPD